MTHNALKNIIFFTSTLSTLYLVQDFEEEKKNKDTIIGVVAESCRSVENKDIYLLTSIQLCVLVCVFASTFEEKTKLSESKERINKICFSFRSRSCYVAS